MVLSSQCGNELFLSLLLLFATASSLHSSPLDVRVTLYIEHVSSMNEKELHFRMDYYLIQEWQAEKAYCGAYARVLAEKNQTLNNAILIGSEAENFWRPDTFFPAAKSSFAQSATVKTTSLNLNQTANGTCNMRFLVR